ncbi:MAG: hypothetical protein JWM68_112 [Verrucomicrobiales bacterium]|nr:hypothetical protein [Verrucomicrobiales bacterium]
MIGHRPKRSHRIVRKAPRFTPIKCTPLRKPVFRNSGECFSIQNRHSGFRRIVFGLKVDVPVSGRAVRRPKSIFQIPEKGFLAKKRFSGNRNGGFRPETGVPGLGKGMLGAKSVFREAEIGCGGWRANFGSPSDIIYVYFGFRTAFST